MFSTRFLRLSLMLGVVAAIATGCTKTVRIETVPPGATVEVFQGTDRPAQATVPEQAFTAPVEVKLRKARHLARVSHPNFEQRDYTLAGRPLNFWEYISFQWIWKSYNLESYQRFSLIPTLDARLGNLAQDMAAELAAKMPESHGDIAIYPFLGNGEVRQLGRIFVENHLRDAFRNQIGSHPRVFEFREVQRYLVNSDLGLGSRSVSENDELAFYANVLGLDLIVVGRIRREADQGVPSRFGQHLPTGVTINWWFDAYLIDPQSGRTLATVTRLLEAAEYDGPGSQIDNWWHQIIAPPYVPPDQEVSAAAHRLAANVLRDYRERGGYEANVKLEDWRSNPNCWGPFAREKFEKELLAKGGGVLTPVAEKLSKTDMRFDPMRAQPRTPQVAPDYDFTIVGDITKTGDIVRILVTLRQPDGTVLITQEANFILSSPRSMTEWESGC